METAKYMNLGEINAEQGLNSFFQGIVSKDKTLLYLEKLNSIEVKKQFVLMITHQVTISAITGITVSSGGAVAFSSKTGESKEIRFLIKKYFPLHNFTKSFFFTTNFDFMIF